MRIFLLAFLLLPLATIAQDKQITLEDLYKKGTFRGEYVPGFEGETMDSMLKAE